VRAEELAHWRYRARNLEQKVKDAPRILLQAKQIQNKFADLEADSPIGPDEMTQLRDEYQCNQWLFEEAKYHVELAAVEDLIGQQTWRK
jgi:hypothetical protein